MSWRDIQGWWEDEWLFEDAVRNSPDPGHFVEVGSWLGRSACCMIELIQRSGKEIRLDCVDTWEGSGHGTHPQRIADLEASGTTLFNEFVKNVSAYKGILCEPVISSSVDAARRYDDGSLDCVFIDADHSAEAVEADCQAWWPKVRSGGMICGHDWPANHEAPRGVRVGVLAAGLNPRHKGMVWWQRK